MKTKRTICELHKLYVLFMYCPESNEYSISLISLIYWPNTHFRTIINLTYLTYYVYKEVHIIISVNLCNLCSFMVNVNYRETKFDSGFFTRLQCYRKKSVGVLKFFVGLLGANSWEFWKFPLDFLKNPWEFLERYKRWGVSIKILWFFTNLTQNKKSGANPYIMLM